MLDLFELVPPDITDVMDVRMTNRWWTDEKTGRLRKARQIRVIHKDLNEITIPMMWDVEKRTWVEDKDFQRHHFKSVASMIRDMKF